MFTAKVFEGINSEPAFSPKSDLIVKSSWYFEMSCTQKSAPQKSRQIINPDHAITSLSARKIWPFRG